eukprot:CAMPEP_0197318430 /NCGR_PEP_ID=MMETSP0891-20130614/51024_1 /TAXON_ID=44058 ORGANISM="Aureoumbra lagunensis, Strain CCMP1510" /NCGR_SAMPLE_ID=MMETSP0891 /ASSEMBLY_ACC=CAM_ASM_000534 /LENGTH=138 /DNA_ID=CAMNT_0042808885 /DNA_START=204 /DNA_END=620 /DNA_ORIENTATION=+
MKKRAMRKLWIMRINAAGRCYGVPYNRFIAGLNNANIDLNRKVLADMAMTEPLSFRSVIEVVSKVDPYLSQNNLKTKVNISDTEKGFLGDWRHVLTEEEIAEIEELEPMEEFDLPFGDGFEEYNDDSTSEQEPKREAV